MTMNKNIYQNLQLFIENIQKISVAIDVNSTEVLNEVNGLIKITNKQGQN